MGGGDNNTKRYQKGRGDIRIIMQKKKLTFAIKRGRGMEYLLKEKKTPRKNNRNQRILMFLNRKNSPVP